MRFELVVFDVGGTVIEDAGHVPMAFETALKAHGYSASKAEISQWRGASKREIIQRAFQEREGSDGGTTERVYRAFQENLIDRFRLHGAHAIEGVEEAFAELKQMGVQIALTTGFDRLITEQVLSKLDWQSFLDAVVCSDDVAAGRPAPYMIFRAMELTAVTSVHAVAKVGDTSNDLLAGHRAGVAANIGVLTGAHDLEQLSRAPHSHIIGSAARVREVLIEAS